MPNHVGPRRHPAWLDALTQFVMFGLGVLCILYPIISRTSHVGGYLITGLVLLGIVRLGDLVGPFIGNREKPQHRKERRHMTTATPDEERERRRDVEDTPDAAAQPTEAPEDAPEGDAQPVEDDETAEGEATPN